MCDCPASTTRPDLPYAQGLSSAEIRWLASTTAENVWLFGRTLGELDIERVYLPSIVALSPPDPNCMLLSSYLLGIANAQGQMAWETILDELSETNPVLAFGATWRGLGTEASALRVIRLVESGKIERRFCRLLMYGGWISSLPLEFIDKIVGLLLQGDPTETIEAVITFLESYVRSNPDRFESVRELVWLALEKTPLRSTGHAEWGWGELARRAAKDNPLRISNLVLSRLESDTSPHIHGDPSIQALAEASELDPVRVWPLVGAQLIQPGISSLRLLLALEKWYGELIPPEVLLNWARANPRQGPRIVARLIRISAPLSDRARMLVMNFPDDDDVLRDFAANLETGSWVGPISSHYEALLQTVDQFRSDPNERVRNWAGRLAEGLKKRIEESKIMEEEEEL